MARTGRRPGGGDTRARIAAAARELFGERGYEGTTVRAVAARAGVDPKLVHHYFGSKEQLFVAVMQLPFEPARDLGPIVGGPPDEVGERLARFVVTSWARPEFRQVVVGLIRSAASDPRAAAMLREVILRQGLPELAGSFGRSNPELRAELVGSQLVGLAMARFVIGIEPLASAPDEMVAAALAPTFQRYLTGDIWPEEAPGAAAPAPTPHASAARAPDAAAGRPSAPARRSSPPGRSCTGQ